MKVKTILNSIMLILILIFTGFIFWLGLENKKLEENSYGIVHTNTSGWSEKVISTDKFNWSFEKVIPGNYALHMFRIESINISFNKNDTLPSGDLYAAFNSIDGNNFKYSYNLTGNMQLNTSYLSSLVAAGEFTQENFQTWQSEKVQDIKNILINYISKKVIDNEVITINAASRDFVAEIYPYYNIGEIFINLNSPDMTLYNNCRNRYIQNIEAQTSADEQYLIQMLKQQNEEQLRLDLLKQYGEVFTKYPIMIEYLKIDTGMVLDRATLNDFIAPQYQK